MQYDPNAAVEVGKYHAKENISDFYGEFHHQEAFKVEEAEGYNIHEYAADPAHPKHTAKKITEEQHQATPTQNNNQ